MTPTRKTVPLAFKLDGVPCMLIPLTKEQYAIVWASDYDLVKPFAWCARYDERTGKYYAVRGARTNGKHRVIYMHREVLGVGRGDKRQGDHVEPMATTDNRRCNLRFASRSENQFNRRKTKANKTGYKGVVFHPHSGLYHALIGVEGKSISLGYYKTAHAAYLVRRAHVPLYHGEFARA